MSERPHFDKLINTMELMLHDHWGHEGTTLMYLGPRLYRTVKHELREDPPVNPHIGGEIGPVPTPHNPDTHLQMIEEPEATPYPEIRDQMAAYGRLIIQDPSIDDRRAVIFDTDSIMRLSPADKKSKKPKYVLKSAAAVRELHLASRKLGYTNSIASCENCGNNVEGEVWVETSDGDVYCDINCLNEEIHR